METRGTYSDRELESKFTNLLEHMKGFEDKVLEKLTDLHDNDERIEAQTTKTNGRVTHLEQMFLVLGTAVAILIALKVPAIAGLLSISL